MNVFIRVDDQHKDITVEVKDNSLIINAPFYPIYIHDVQMDYHVEVRDDTVLVHGYKVVEE